MAKTKVEDYAKQLLRGQITCLTTDGNHHHQIIETARLMDVYIERGWSNKLCMMPIERSDGFRHKIHNFALGLL